MRIEVTKQGEFIPKWNGNLELPSDEQIIVRWTRLSKAERKRFSKTSNSEIIIHNFGDKSDKDIDKELDQTDLKTTVNTDTDGMLKAMKITFENLETNEGAIATWEEINRVPGNYFDGLILEVTTHVQSESKLDGEDSKN